MQDFLFDLKTKFLVCVSSITFELIASFESRNSTELIPSKKSFDAQAATRIERQTLSIPVVISQNVHALQNVTPYRVLVLFLVLGRRLDSNKWLRAR